jgi:DNA-directed RNA polymerase beta' subunit
MPSGFSKTSSDIESVVGIQFSIFSPDEIERRSVVEVTLPATYEGNEPKIGGLFDPRMGVLDNGKICRSCGQTNHDCPGHFGHYRLARPVYYYQFMDMILNVLKCICIRCSKLLIDKEKHKDKIKKRGEARWRDVLKACSDIKRCGQDIEDGCGAIKPQKFTKEGIARIVAHYTGRSNESLVQDLEVEYVHRLFRRITDDDVDFMGLSRYWCRPDWMICTLLPIPPPQVRPSVVQDNNQRSEDDLTHKLFEIIKNDRLLDQKLKKTKDGEKPDRKVIDDMTNLVQYHVATLVDNQIPGVAPSAQRSGRPLKSIQQRLGSKEGRIRYNIQGKRVEFSARSVITPDPNISISELGVPIEIASNLTYPERVTEYNRDKLYKLVQNGADKYPGAKTLVKKDGRMISLKHKNPKDIVLQNGDIVNRHLLDNDILLFNRQPTLHKMSMMAHRVKVLPYKTFRLNVLVTRPYNADFDGDEMNAHIPQSEEAATELEEIAAIPYNIVTPRHAEPLIGVFQDTLVGSYRLTRPESYFNRREFMNLMMNNIEFNGILPEPNDIEMDEISRKLYTGQQVLSKLLPPINMELGGVQIVKGNILKGQINKAAYMKSGKGIIHITYNDYGPKKTVDLLDSLQTTISNYLVMNGFSIGISDLVADENTMSRAEETIQNTKKDVDEIIAQVHTDIFENNTGRSNQEEFENKVMNTLKKGLDEVGSSVLKSLSTENRLIAMVNSGSKGSTLNVAQMISILGQQNIEGKRVAYGFTDRTLPHYKKYDDGTEARGFIESSFIRGLTPQEFFFHAMSGREGLIDTAVKTAETGYIQRQLIKSMEDLVVQHDGTVRDAKMNIVQYYYGEDSIMATKIERQDLALNVVTEEDIRNQYGMVDFVWTGVLQDGVEIRHNNPDVEKYVENILSEQKMLIEGVFKNNSLDANAVQAPVNLARIILNIKIEFDLPGNPPRMTDLTPDYVLNGIEKIIDKTRSRHNKIWITLLHYYMAPHKLIIADRFNKVAYDLLCETIVIKYLKSWVQPGEQVGIVAAQSIGEPSTQMSAHGSTTICITNGGSEKFYGEIKNFIDPIIEKNKDKLITIGKDSVVLKLEDDYFIVGVSDDEKTSWKRISEISRHPANGGMVEVVTKSGRKTTATLSHSFLKRSKTGIVPVLGSDLKLGMRIPVARIIPQVPGALYSVTQGKTIFNLNKDFGWLCGVYLADGCFNGNLIKITKIHPVVEDRLKAISDEYEWTFTTKMYSGVYGPSKDNNIYSKDLKDFLLSNFKEGSYDKEISGLVFHSNKEFIAGLIGGYFDGDGNVSVERQMIRVGSRSKKLIHQMNSLLGYCGIFGSLSEETSIRIPDKIMYTLCILRKFAAEYKKQIGFNLSEKAAALDEIIKYNERNDKHSSMEYIDKIPELGEVIAETGKLLRMPGQSRTYGRWLKKESIGRLTLENYVSDFKEMIAIYVDDEVKDKINENMNILESALNADVVWDEIVELNYKDDPKEFVYDFTIPGNDSFMVDDNILVHNTLNTFHTAGSKSNVTTGVPRLKELLKISKNPKATSLTIYLKPEYKESKEKAREVIQDLELTLLRNITKKVAIYWDPTDEATLIEEDKELLDFYKIFENGLEVSSKIQSKWILRLELNREEMFNKNISMADVAYVIKSKFDNTNLVYSDYNSKNLIVRIRLDISKIKDDSTHSELDDFNVLKKFQNNLLNNTIVRGVLGIKAVTMRKDDKKVEWKDGKYEKVTQFILESDGSNFAKVANHYAVDPRYLYTTNVHDIIDILGLEAVRSILINEMETLFSEVGINYRHLGLLCDMMTRSGRLMSIDRYGINKNDIGPLAKMSFEETERITLRAALHSEVDPVTGVSANIMTGQPFRGGTAFSQILLDETMLVELNKKLGEPETIEEEDEDYVDISDETEGPCGKVKFNVNISAPPEVKLNEEEDIEINVVEGDGDDDDDDYYEED